MTRSRPIYPILCTARDGSHTLWLYEIEESTESGQRVWYVRARPYHPQYDGVDWYGITLTEIDAESVQITSVHNGASRPFQGRGVGPVLYPDVARRLGRRLVSSRTNVRDSNEFRTPRATAIWEYLVQRGEAQKDGAADRYVIDGRPGASALPNGPERLTPLRPPPKNEEEFQELMESIDATLRAEGVPIVGRELAGGAELSRVLAIDQYPHLAKGEPLPGIYEGLDLTIRIKRWFRSRYGERLNVDFSPGQAIVQLRGDCWLVRLPLMIGRHVLIASRTEKSDPGGVREDIGPPARFNVLDSIVELSDTYRAGLTDEELNASLYVFEIAMGAFRAMRDCRDVPFVREAISDHLSAVQHLTGQAAHAGQSRWSSLQAAEKMYKSYLDSVGQPVKKIHDIHQLGAEAAHHGLDPADPHFIAAVQCDAGVRYGQTPTSVNEAVAAHHAALELSWYIGEEIRRVRGLPRRPI